VTLSLAGVALAAFGLVLAWLLYRLEVAVSWRREVSAARAVLLGVKRGMVEGVGRDDVGWAEHYFRTGYDAQAAADRAAVDNAAVMSRGHSYVFKVPTEPLELLIASPATGELVSDETVFAANVGLWRIGVFNQFVDMQTLFYARFFPDVVSPSTEQDRRAALAMSAEAISTLLHGQGIGEANVTGGWYQRLKAAIDADIARLDHERSVPLLSYRRDRWLALGDLAAIGLVGAFCTFLALQAAS
jgi:hypothetical protein